MSSKYAGYMGKVMMVDLSTETITEYPWNDEQRELYLGGKIMAARILYDHLTGKETAFLEKMLELHIRMVVDATFIQTAENVAYCHNEVEEALPKWFEVTKECIQVQEEILSLTVCRGCYRQPY
jgi:aldehyde:ferredoxin oxidoreductase